MAHRRVWVQLDDELVERLDEMAERLGTTRSVILRRGAVALIEADDLARADADLQAAYRREAPDPTLLESTRRLAATTAPEW